MSRLDYVDPADTETIVRFLGDRYGTYDPYVWADRLNIQIEWVDFNAAFAGRTDYWGEQPIITLNKEIKKDNRQYHVLAHEIGHVILQQGLVGYYTLNSQTKSVSEAQANAFAMQMMIGFYEEQEGHKPETYQDLVNECGLPYLE